MSTWNYRVFRDPRYEPEVLTIVEAYTDDGDTEPSSWCSADVVTEEGVDGLRWTLTKMLEALDKPIMTGPVLDDAERR